MTPTQRPTFTQRGGDGAGFFTVGSSSLTGPVTFWRMSYKTPYAPGSPIAAIPWSTLTHVAHVGYSPNSDGTLRDFTNSDQAALISAAHAAGVRVLADISDSTGGDFTGAITNNLATLVTNIMNVVNTWGYDGVDIDAEQSGTVAQIASLATALRTALGSKHLSVTTLQTNYASWNAGNTASLDRLNPLTYDMAGTFDPYTWFHDALYGPTPVVVWSIELARTRFITSGVPASKLNMGIPFYGYRSLGGTPPNTGPRQTYGSPTPTFTQMDYPTLQSTFDLSNPVIDPASGNSTWITITNGWVQWDAPSVVANKVQYCLDNGLGGFYSFSIEKDYISAGATPALKHPLLSATVFPPVGPNLIVSPNDLTNVKWVSGGGGCTKTNATTYTTASALCSLWQVINVAQNTYYTAQVTITLVSGAAQAPTLSISTTGFTQLASQAFALTVGVPKVFTCTANSGANSQLQFEIDTSNAAASVLSINLQSFR